MGHDGWDQQGIGDIEFTPGVIVDVKHRRELAIPEWLRQVEADAGNRIPVIWVHRPGLSDVGDWWAITRVHQFVDLIR